MICGSGRKTVIEKIIIFKNLETGNYLHLTLSYEKADFLLSGCVNGRLQG
jgi:hypothetical protein